MLKNRFYFVTFVAFLKVHLGENLNTAHTHKAVSNEPNIIGRKSSYSPSPNFHIILLE